MCSITQVTIAISRSDPPVIAVTIHILRLARWEGFKIGSSGIDNKIHDVSSPLRSSIILTLGPFACFSPDCALLPCFAKRQRLLIESVDQSDHPHLGGGVAH
jgi:hypothetical protein